MPKPHLRILCVEDDADHAAVLRRALEAVPDLEIDFTVVPRADDLLAEGEGGHDLLFIDYRLDPTNGLDVLRELRDAEWMKPVILLTAPGDEYIAADATRLGADGYLIKDDIAPERLALVMKAARERAVERGQLRALQARVAKLEELSMKLAESNTAFALEARTDGLTQVMNRRSWEEAAATEHERSARHGHTYAIVIADVDHFKKFNDAAGHPAGDDCLRRIAQVLRQCCRHTDSVGRYGGEEFVLLLPETARAEAGTLAERILTALHDAAMPHPGLDPGAIVTCSFGIATGPGAHAALADVIRAADTALYAAKAAGRNRVRLAG